MTTTPYRLPALRHSPAASESNPYLAAWRDLHRSRLLALLGHAGIVASLIAGLYVGRLSLLFGVPAMLAAFFGVACIGFFDCPRCHARFVSNKYNMYSQRRCAHCELPIATTDIAVT